MHNKKAYWKKAASDSKKIIKMFPINEAELAKSNINLIFEDTYDNSDDDEDFTLKSLNLLLKKNKDDLRLQIVSQFLHLVQDQGFTKMNASNFFA